MSVRPYIAKITGYDPKYVFRRQFVNGHPRNMDFYNPVHRAMLDNGIYEARDINGDKKFFEITDSDVDEVAWDYVLSVFKPAEPLPPYSACYPPITLDSSKTFTLICLSCRIIAICA